METIEKIYKIGYGPSSSHTMGPRKAADIFINQHAEAVRFRVTLYGSLATTGKGHLTDRALFEIFGKEKLELIWEPDTFLPFHPNGMLFEAFNSKNGMIGNWTTFSVGGGDISDEKSLQNNIQVYEMNTMNAILKWCEENGRTFWEYVEDCEGPEIWKHLAA